MSSLSQNTATSTRWAGTAFPDLGVDAGEVDPSSSQWPTRSSPASARSAESCGGTCSPPFAAYFPRSPPARPFGRVFCPASYCRYAASSRAATPDWDGPVAHPDSGCKARPGRATPTGLTSGGGHRRQLRCAAPLAMQSAKPPAKANGHCRPRPRPKKPGWPRRPVPQHRVQNEPAEVSHRAFSADFLCRRERHAGRERLRQGRPGCVGADNGTGRSRNLRASCPVRCVKRPKTHSINQRLWFPTDIRGARQSANVAR